MTQLIIELANHWISNAQSLMVAMPVDVCIFACILAAFSRENAESRIKSGEIFDQFYGSLIILMITSASFEFYFLV